MTDKVTPAEKSYVAEPQTAALLQAIAASGLPPLHTLPPAEARKAFVERVKLSNLPPEPVEDVRDIAVAARDCGEIRLRVYRPSREPASPVVLYFHGGGFVIGGLDTHDPICRYLAARSGWCVISVDYRLAPEHRYPTAVHDALDAFEWIWAHVDELRIDRDRIAVAGDSAGATLAAVVAQHARRQARHLSLQVLVYPALDQSGDYPSKTEFRDRFILTSESIAWFARHYFGHDRAQLESDASPARAETLQGLAPACIITAELDPLRDEAARYAAALEGAGVKTIYRCVKGTIHGFLGMARYVSAARDELDAIVAVLRSAPSLRRNMPLPEIEP